MIRLRSSCSVASPNSDALVVASGGEKGRVRGGRHRHTGAQGNRWQRIRGSNDAALSGWGGGRWIRESPDEVSSGECGLWSVEWTTGAAVPLEITVLRV